eukprot:NODE_2832_length_1111_cov_55.715631_g2596_i0.p1 GENE.NODE_2832_length_1111_cov_55.715631_g2596_i0~~NODE_2832_length_1111_cov_55.715631_g2596_i0.p1  ORF type:complete len:294 (-),score=49.02 NODE_2832_length_1111_cov_55.715631_g2596_i0:228-1034(-)
MVLPPSPSAPSTFVAPPVAVQSLGSAPMDSSSCWDRLPIVSRTLLSLCCAIYVMQYVGMPRWITSFSCLSPLMVVEHYQLHRLITSALCHGSPLHLVVNMLALIGLGPALEARLSSSCCCRPSGCSWGRTCRCDPVLDLSSDSSKTSDVSVPPLPLLELCRRPLRCSLWNAYDRCSSTSSPKCEHLRALHSVQCSSALGDARADASALARCIIRWAPDGHHDGLRTCLHQHATWSPGCFDACLLEANEKLSSSAVGAFWSPVERCRIS